jgi:hypothetical protein
MFDTAKVLFTVQIEFGKAKVLGPDILLSINNTLKKQGKKPL